MKFILEHLFMVGVAVLSGGALLVTSLMGRGKKASPLEVTLLINRGKTTILDVRDAAEYANGHLAGAKHLPLAELKTRIGELDKSKSKTVVVVCQSGSRANQAVAALAKAGFEDAVALDGGVAAWQAAGLPLVK